jgi:Kdo2-lipid IVA lauroyltransferase/acyltransferase
MLSPSSRASGARLAPGMSKAKRHIPTFLHRPIYAGIRSIISFMGSAPAREALLCAKATGRLFGLAPFNRKRLQRAIDNLAVARPKWDESSRREYALRAYEHLFMLAVEMTCAERVLSRDGWPGRVDVETMGPTLRRLLEHGPVISITGHCGNWELLGYMVAQLGFPVTALYRPLDLKPLDGWIRRTREAHGLHLLDKFGAGENLPDLLRGGRIAAFVADQNAGDRGIFVPFFGRLASTYKSIGLLALHTNKAIVCTMARRMGNPCDTWDEEGRLIPAGVDPHAGPPGSAPLALRYRMEVVDVITQADWSGQPDPLFYISARYRRAIEKMVALAPEQFLWMHRYWKSRPRHEREGREFPSALRHKLEQLPWMTQGELERILEHSRRDTTAFAGSRPAISIPARVPQPQPA